MKVVFSLHDHKLNYFNQPFFANNYPEAISSIRSALMSDGQLRMFAQDLELRCIGFFDEMTGQLRIPFDEEVAAYPSIRLDSIELPKEAKSDGD